MQKMASTLLFLQLGLCVTAGCSSTPEPVVSDIAASYADGTDAAHDQLAPGVEDAIHDRLDTGSLDAVIELHQAAEVTLDKSGEHDLLEVSGPEVAGPDLLATDIGMPDVMAHDSFETTGDSLPYADSSAVDVSEDGDAAPDVAAEDISSQCGDCDDGIPCTVDQCHPQAGCKHIPDHSLCDDDDVCTWDACDENEGCIHDPSKLPCDDEDPCTVNDSCWLYECIGTPMDCGQGHQCKDGQCVCQPDCEDTECGWDGCGGSCGECDPGWGCVWDACVEGEAPCPPPAPYGTDVGDYIHPVSLKSCTGALYSMHDLCTSKASWVFLFSGT